MRTLKMADLFCGAGGTSTGAIEAAAANGYEVELTAINHWDVAIATHKANHPDANHKCTAIDNINPRDLYAEGELDLLWASPECTNHSAARGGRPINDQSRATAHCVTRWAEALMPRVILVENVPEFVDWGPLKTVRRQVKTRVPAISYRKWRRTLQARMATRKPQARASRKAWKKAVGTEERLVWRDVHIPIEERKGELFHAWIKMLEAAGYRVQWRVLCCANYGDPTTRERLFVYAVRGKRRIIWPEPTHRPAAEVSSGDLFGTRLKPWVPARTIIDWSDKGRSIFCRDKPLARKTLERIFIGLARFGGLPFLFPPARGNGSNAGLNLMPVILGQHGGAAARSVDQPVPTVATAGAISLTTPELLPQKTAPQTMDTPMGLARAGSPKGLAQPFLVKMRGSKPGQVQGSAQSIERPVPTLTAGGGHVGLANPCLIEVNHGNGNDPKANERRVHSVDEPLKTLTAKNGVGVAHASLVCMEHGGREKSVDQPLPTVTTAKGGAIGVACGELVAAADPTESNGGQTRPDQPLFSITTDSQLGVAPSFLIKYNGTGNANSIDEPLDTVTTKDRFGLVSVLIDRALTPKAGLPLLEINGEQYYLDVYFRMLKYRELSAANGFRTDYKFVGTTQEIVRQIGNAVPRRTARALVYAALSQSPDVPEFEDDIPAQFN